MNYRKLLLFVFLAQGCFGGWRNQAALLRLLHKVMINKTPGRKHDKTTAHNNRFRFDRDSTAYFMDIYCEMGENGLMGVTSPLFHKGTIHHEHTKTAQNVQKKGLCDMWICHAT